MFINPSDIQSAFRSFSSVDGWTSPYAVTFTMKQAMTFDGDKGPVWLALTPELASKNLRHFYNRLNKACYGNAGIRFNKRVPLIPVLEGGNGKRLHYHCMIECPRDDLRAGFPDLLASLWRQTPWGYDQIDIQPNADNGFINYISKIRDKPNYADAVDWDNYHTFDR